MSTSDRKITTAVEMLPTGALLDAEAGMRWWNGLTENARAFWLEQCGSAVPADAWATYKLAKCSHTGVPVRFCTCAAHEGRS